jgi:hypothetical protein
MQKSLTAIGLSLFLAGPVAADEMAIQLHGISYHATRDTYNESNFGLAVRVYDTNKKYDYWTVGTYDNSENSQSFYAGFGWEYKATNYLKLGISAGIITGYERYNVVPYVTPVITIMDRLHLVAAPYPEPVMEISFDILHINI